MAEKLKDMPVGTKIRVRAITDAGRSFRHKLLSMGLTPGTTAIVMRVAPLGDPIEIQLRGYMLTLRKAEADALDVERL